jgi:hypothetical protein
MQLITLNHHIVLVFCSLLMTTILFSVTTKLPYYNNIEPEFIPQHTRANGTVVEAYERQGKQFQVNRWVDVPKRIKRRDPEFIKYNQWRIAMGMTDLF